MVFERLVGLSVALLLVSGAGLMVAQRASHERWYYISEFGARGLSTEADFRVGFTMLALGLLLAAWPLRRIRTKPWPVWGTIALAGVVFLVASQVNCTEGCPGLGNPNASVQDLVHIWFAIAGFVLGCIAMLQIAFTSGRRLRALTLTAMALVAVISSTGGILSLAGSQGEIGAICEHIAAGIGVAWLVLIVLRESTRFAPIEPRPDTPTAAAGSKHPQPADAVHGSE